MYVNSWVRVVHEIQEYSSSTINDDFAVTLIHQKQEIKFSIRAACMHLAKNFSVVILRNVFDIVSLRHVLEIFELYLIHIK